MYCFVIGLYLKSTDTSGQVQVASLNLGYRRDSPDGKAAEIKPPGSNPVNTML